MDADARRGLGVGQRVGLREEHLPRRDAATVEVAALTVDRPVDRRATGVAPDVGAVIIACLACSDAAPCLVERAKPPDERVDVELPLAEQVGGKNDAGGHAREAVEIVHPVVPRAAVTERGELEVEQVDADAGASRPGADAVQDEADRVVVARRDEEVGTIGEFLPAVPRPHGDVLDVGGRVDERLLDD